LWRVISAAGGVVKGSTVWVYLFHVVGSCG